MKVAFHTLGCKVNQYETEALKEKFNSKGYQIVEEKDFADIYIINTCTVTNLADRKSRQYIRKMKKVNPESIVAVTGCYAQISPDEVAAIEEVNLIAGTNEKGRLVEYVEEYISEKHQHKSCHVLPYEKLTKYDETGIITSMESKTRAFIKIQEGCNRFCSYCIIPYARGFVRSRDIEDIILEAKNLIDKGFKEIVLTGINTALFGMDKDENESGVEIIIEKLNNLEGDFRIRLSSLEPTVVNKEYVKKLFKYDKLCHHLHLSVQSGSDSILESMNRKYSQVEYLEIVKMLRDFDPFYGISTDIIAGFPGETDEDFKESLEIIEKAQFCRIHAFPYSKRDGTVASNMEGQIPPDIKSTRTKLLISQGEEVASKFLKKCEGQISSVLIEEENDGFLSGYSDNYLKIYIKSDREQLINEFVKVRMMENYKDGLMGEII